MDLQKMKVEDKVELCKKYFYGGFALLPFLWVVNFVWFFKEAFIKQHYEQQQQIRSYVIKSLIGAIIWTAIFITWVTLFQLYRASWGATADYISFIIPRGIA
ncbi:gamma-secretase subunit PEN-2 [Lingula anatina]|uniref:Gamma-secretase subunit PEN-2 n=1 Tax=Lingula anatina TaxID=7574 RepID=A0A1S3IH21_LINAN|nr:gamma-secretase subunit PEN-2 [Lingula anatina]XP_013397555.1 gamma-secretase subunit PEN-2 [Lingula anatina]|eukprot:XP_013397554.1 gamma-secretase subunit PEN-2 [Lingula anatina]